MYNSVSCRTTIIKYSNIQQTEDYTWRQLPHFRRAPSSRLAILRITKSFLWIDSISLIKFWRIRCKPKRLFLTYNVLGCIVPHSCSPSFANLAESWNGSLARKWFLLRYSLLIWGPRYFLSIWRTNTRQFFLYFSGKSRFTFEGSLFLSWRGNKGKSILVQADCLTKETYVKEFLCPISNSKGKCI